MSGEFRLWGGDAEFNSRNKSVFDQLSSLSPRSAAAAPAVSLSDLSRASPRRRSKEKETTRQLRGQESLFKRPELPPPRHQPRQPPDHHKNPHRWTHYTLGDVSRDDMSDRTNTSTALSFLDELRKRRERDGEDMEVDGQPPQPVLFKKPVRSARDRKKSPEPSKSGEGPVFQGTKRVMPEYVVGQKRRGVGREAKESRKGDKPMHSDSKKLKLLHLLKDDDDDDQDNATVDSD
ncbi:U5 small nuclear ribonucleoprotein TSSC4 [Cloeon dipterum]|uniref:U5 small nuclear ribonucleoprotein TSSC4 n=1 Tax=Cloeon dipterum TaxID=197152 RepID=UPI00322096AF